ncbi:MAG: hypothetical protein GWP91_10075 [Rhodobacterales bacterium]|nr:hypothetical protein [Rhodobacterales bacterium]
MTLLLALFACSSPVVAIEDAPNTPMLRQRTVTLTGGVVRADLSTSWSRTCTPDGRMPSKGVSKCQDLFFAVAPVVGPNWSTADPVNAWLSCPDRVDSVVECDKIFKAQTGDLTGRVLSLFESDGDSGWVKAIAAGRDGLALVSVEKAPIMLAPEGSATSD